jgi:tetratricopeptide (TPR) repeat protein
MLLASACGTKKNTAISRNWQAFTTRYNVYYNGSEHYKETLKDMEAKYEDDYTRDLLMHPAEARADDKYPQPTGDFKRTIEKMQKSIQLHSIKKKPAKKSGSQKEKEFRNREEFNPFLHNAWLMMGRAQYFNGDFLGAASTFLYISKHFKWLPDVVTEAQLWQARCYCALDWNYEAENVLRRIKEKDLTKSSLTDLYNFVEADYLLRNKEYDKAIPFLTQACKKASGSQKNRLYFLLGQVYSYKGDKNKAYQAFKKAAGGTATAYRTKFNARIKQSEVYTGSNIKGEVNSLKSMIRFERNKEYLDQIYYAIGNLYLSRRDTAEAKKNYILAAEKSTRNGIDKALAQLALGNIYFNERDYVKAQPCYSEAVPQLSQNYPGYKDLKRRSDVLDELAVYAGNVHLQDSLLTLSKLSPEEQEKVCQKIVDELKKKEKEEAEAAKREEYLASQEGNNANINQSNAPTTFQLNSDKSWYFYNTTAKNTGKTEFQKRWGARKLEDDWRRRNKNTFSLDDTSSDEESNEPDKQPAAGNDSISAEKQKEIDKQNDPHFVEYYLKQIPSTDEERQTCNDIIQEGLYNMGIILKDKLDDYPAARAEFTELDTRYPDNIYRLDVYYNMYLMAVREDDTSQAEYYRQLIVSQFPESPYGQAMVDPNYFTNLRRMNVVQEQMYDEAYEAYLGDNNKSVHRITAEMEKDYPLSKILPKFVFIDALSYVTEKDNDKFKERLEYLLQKWPDTDMTEMASGILRNIAAGRTPRGGMSNSRGMLWDTRLSNDDTATDSNGQPANFEHDPKSPQYLVLAFPRDSISANQLLYDVARFNFSSFVVKDFDLEQMSFGNVGLLIVKGFSNVKELEHYRTVMAKSSILQLSPAIRPIVISKPNFELLLREGRSFEEYFRYQEDESVKETEDNVLNQAEETNGQENTEEDKTAPQPTEEDTDNVD